MISIKVSGKSNCNKIASYISYIIKQKDELEVNTIGAGSLNQLVKSIIISKGFLAPLGISIVCIPSFIDVKIDDTIKTGIKMLIKKVDF